MTRFFEMSIEIARLFCQTSYLCDVIAVPHCARIDGKLILFRASFAIHLRVAETQMIEVYAVLRTARSPSAWSGRARK